MTFAFCLLLLLAFGMVTSPRDEVPAEPVEPWEPVYRPRRRRDSEARREARWRQREALWPGDQSLADMTLGGSGRLDASGLTGDAWAVQTRYLRGLARQGQMHKIGAPAPKIPFIAAVLGGSIIAAAAWFILGRGGRKRAA